MRRVAQVTGGFRERLFLFDGGGIDQRNSERITQIADSFGGDTVEGPEFSTPAGLGGWFNTDVFTITRRSTLGVAEYLDRHTTSPGETHQPAPD